jgi:ADP-heptose:LPS heptosyltransferase
VFSLNTGMTRLGEHATHDGLTKRCLMRSSPIKFENAVLFQNGSIGDFLMSVFLAELLRDSGCVDCVTIVVPRNLNFLRGLIGAYPYISAIEVSRRRGWVQPLKMTRGPTLVIIQPTVDTIPLRIKIVAWLFSRRRGSEYVGFQDKGPLCKTLYSKTLVYNTDQLYSETMRNVVRALGAPVLGQIPALKIAPDFKHVQACDLDQRRYMVFHPGASTPKRSFTVQTAREVIEHVLKRNPEMHVVLSGSSAEGKWIEEIRNGIQNKERIFNAVGCSAQELAAFIQSAQFFIGPDSGITHLACFLRARVIVAAHYGTANWLPFYCPSATVLYRLAEEEAVHQSRDYLDAQRRGRLKPLGRVPTHAICAVIDRFLGGLDSEAENAQEVVFGENGYSLCNSR